MALKLMNSVLRISNFHIFTFFDRRLIVNLQFATWQLQTNAIDNELQ